ncbi:sigma factor-like helix-turn-helix DNA-binding protein [Streptomyces sp. GC420]|uniref:sigma factor-like helix-turn-helix DNA-binding protein n=1 Tax=Streptomyces sp. GC420 TaxID=2697568 RepID=UPI001414D224|nr:sigma factor-like helix-turn-helix DNA-binding protein [Streptomyces sp. GC420]
MRERQTDRRARRAREFQAFVGGAGGRLLHAATLLTGDGAAARRLLTGDGAAARRLLARALADTYADWDRLRGEDPYDHTRRQLAIRFAHTAWRYRRGGDGVLGRLTPQQRLILVLRLYEGVAEEQTAALLGLPAERVRVICARAVGTLRAGPPQARRRPRVAEAVR